MILITGKNNWKELSEKTGITGSKLLVVIPEWICAHFKDSAFGKRFKTFLYKLF